MNELIKINSLRKVYSNGSSFIALKKVSLTVFEQDYLAIVGPSGAGKSTLLHVIGGLEAPSSGQVLFRGEELYRMNDNQLSGWRNENIGFVFQFYHLIEELNLAENVAIAAFKEKRKYSLKKAKELLKYLGLEERMDSFPSQLSGGEKQRVAIARALIVDPQILLCDEPTGNLDKESQNKIVELLEKLNKEQKKTVILVTHNKELAQGAKKVVFIENGLTKGEER